MAENDPSWDLSEMLRQWPYEAGRLNVRLIEGTDGEQRIQMRLDLGILQMQVDGRPDGQRPRGFESLLEFHEARLDASLRGAEQGELDRGRSEDVGDAFEASGSGASGEFVLAPEDCRELREEAVQYYHRYMALLMLEDYEGVVRDTSRNLRVLDLCQKHAQAEEDRLALEPFRAYITMMRARALASQALKDNEPKAALHAIDEGLDALRQHFSSAGQEGAFETSGEVQMLRGMRDALVPKLPTSPRSDLRKRLDAAVKAENYELAAILRDELKMMGE